MIELFEDPREDKKSDRPAPASLVKFRQISQDALKGAGEARIKAQKDKGKFTVFLICWTRTAFLKSAV